METIINSVAAPIKDIEILGNTIQDENNLEDIQSVGISDGNGLYKVEVVSCGKNLFDGVYSENTALRFSGEHLGEEYSADGFCCSSNFIKVSPNTEIYLKDWNQAWVVEYDSNKKGLTGGEVYGQVITNKETSYIKFYTTNGRRDNFIVSISDDFENYTPHESHKSEILLPCPLDIGDRLYYDGENWCIDKSIKDAVITGDEEWWGETSGDYTTFQVIDFNPPSKSAFGFCNRLKFKKTWNSQEKGIWIDHNLTISLPSSEADDLDSFMAWLDTNNVTIKFRRNSPEKIVLPKSVQISLNSYIGKTHIYFVDGIKGTIKGKVAKSLGASVNSNTNAIDDLRQEIKDIANMKGSEDFSYEGEGSIVCQNTNEGVIKEFELEGKTLVNMFKMSYYAEHDIRFELADVKYKDTIDKIISFVNNSDKEITVNTYNKDNQYIKTETILPQSIRVFDTTSIYLHQINGLKSKGWVSAEDIRKHSIMLLGDYSNVSIDNFKNLSYFEGLQSVGQDVDKIEVLSKNNYDATIIPLRFNGRFNFSVDGVNNVKWVYSDGTESTSLSQDKTINEDSYCLLYIYDEDISKMELKDNGTDNSFIGDLSDFAEVENYLSLYGCNNVTGSIDNLSKITNYLSLSGCQNIIGSIDSLSSISNTLNLYNCKNITGLIDNLSGIANFLNLANCPGVTGSIDSLSNVTDYLNLYNCPKITGSIDNLSKITNYLSLSNCPNITGSIDNLNRITGNLYLSDCTHITGSLDNLSNITGGLYLTNCTQVTGVFTPSAMNKCPELNLRNTGQTVEDVDDTLIAIANMTNANINKLLEFNQRSSTSDAAVTKLKGFGCTIKCAGVTQ